MGHMYSFGFEEKAFTYAVEAAYVLGMYVLGMNVLGLPCASAIVMLLNLIFLDDAIAFE